MGQPCEKELEITKIKEDVANTKLDFASTKAIMMSLDSRVNGSYNLFEKHCNSTGKRTLTIVLSLSGVVLSIVTLIITFAFSFGRLTRTVEASEKAIAKLEDKIDGQR